MHGNILHHFYVNKIRFWLISLMFPLGHGTSSASKRAQSSASVALHWSGFYSSFFSILKCIMLPPLSPASPGPLLAGVCSPSSSSSSSSSYMGYVMPSDMCLVPCGISAHLQQPQPEACFLAEAPPAGVWPSACKRPFWQRKYPQPAMGIAWMSYPISSLKKKKKNLPN